MDEKHVASQGWQARMFKDLEDAAVAQVVARAEDGFERPLSEAEREDLEDRLVCDAHALHANLMPRMEVVAVSLVWLLADWPLDEDLFWDRVREAVEEAAKDIPGAFLHPQEAPNLMDEQVSRRSYELAASTVQRMARLTAAEVIANARDLGNSINRGLGRSLAVGLPETEWPAMPGGEAA